MTLIDRLAGRWEGDGAGHYPTISPFGYVERLTFTQLADRPVLHYVQRSWDRDGGAPLHSETGYLRVDGAAVELVIVQPTGFAEVHHGHVADGGAIDFGITTLGRTATALAVETIRRRWVVQRDRMVTELWMTYGGVVDGHHLRAELHPVDD